MALLTMALLTTVLLTTVLLTMALLTMALLTMALPTMALPTMALLTMALLTWLSSEAGGRPPTATGAPNPNHPNPNPNQAAALPPLWVRHSSSVSSRGAASSRAALAQSGLLAAAQLGRRIHRVLGCSTHPEGAPGPHSPDPMGRCRPIPIWRGPVATSTQWPYDQLGAALHATCSSPPGALLQAQGRCGNQLHKLRLAP